jgi:hypothetical protein
MLRWIPALLASFILFSSPAQASEFTAQEVEASLKVLKAAHAGEERKGDYLVRIGLNSVGGGAAAFTVGIGLIKLQEAGLLAETRLLGALIPTLTTSGSMAFAIGMITAEVGIFINIITPVPAQAATIDQRFLGSEEGLKEFLRLPIERQIALARWSRPLQLVSIAMAAEVIRVSEQR